MSAYMIVQLRVKDPQAMERYVKIAFPTITQFGGETLGSGPWLTLFGDTDLPIGAITRFPDKETALKWYNSPEYQAAVADRTEAMEIRMQVIEAN